MEERQALLEPAARRQPEWAAQAVSAAPAVVVEKAGQRSSNRAPAASISEPTSFKQAAAPDKAAPAGATAAASHPEGQTAMAATAAMAAKEAQEAASPSRRAASIRRLKRFRPREEPAVQAAAAAQPARVVQAAREAAAAPAHAMGRTVHSRSHTMTKRATLPVRTSRTERNRNYQSIQDK